MFIFMLIMVVKWHHVIEQQQVFFFLTFCFVYGFNVSKILFHGKLLLLDITNGNFKNIYITPILNPLSDIC